VNQLLHTDNIGADADEIFLHVCGPLLLMYICEASDINAACWLLKVIGILSETFRKICKSPIIFLCAILAFCTICRK
jgi:hypothetical protein